MSDLEKAELETEGTNNDSNRRSSSGNLTPKRSKKEISPVGPTLTVLIPIGDGSEVV